MNFSGNSSGRDSRWRPTRSQNNASSSIGGGSFLKIFKSWRREAPDPNRPTGAAGCLKGPAIYFAIDDLVKQTKFSREEIRSIYRDFKQKCPNGILTESGLVEIYSYYFLCGDCTLFSKHLFSALVQQEQNSQKGHFASEITEINFQQFLKTLSILMRGTPDEKIRWMFYFYDLNRDGMVSRDEVSSMIKSMYYLMGMSVYPPVDENIHRQHVEAVIEKLDMGSNKLLSYEQFYQWFSKVD